MRVRTMGLRWRGLLVGLVGTRPVNCPFSQGSPAELALGRYEGYEGGAPVNCP